MVCCVYVIKWAFSFSALSGRMLTLRHCQCIFALIAVVCGLALSLCEQNLLSTVDLAAFIKFVYYINTLKLIPFPPNALPY